MNFDINEAMKNFPRRPIGDLHSVPHYRCPECNGAVVLYEDDVNPYSCKWCGQRLNWSD